MDIDRREFLIGLLSLTTVPVLMNFNLEIPEDIEKAWDALYETPFVFQVDSDGILDDYSYDAPILRKDAYLIPTIITSMNDLLFCMEWQPFAWVIDSKYNEFVESLSRNEQMKWLSDIDDGSTNEQKLAIDDWSNNIGKKDFIAQVNSTLQEWLNDKVDKSNEEVYVDEPLYGGSYVFNFFNSEPELMDQLDIFLVEGFHPGDNSQHAKLNIPIKKANEICRNENIPIRFEIT